MAAETPQEIQQVHPEISLDPRAEVMTYIEQFLKETQEIASLISAEQVEKLVYELKALRDRGGRLFLVGLGGSAANCSHAVNDFRKLCGIEAYTPVDNVSELTARANDDGWAVIYQNWLRASNGGEKDLLFVLSVGGGTNEVSLPLSCALLEAHERSLRIIGIIGRQEWNHTIQWADVCVVIPTVNSKHVTPHTEAFQMVLLHCIVSHPDLQIRSTKW
jgi:D-sedoheptulose 7-phosphate isomerase